MEKIGVPDESSQSGILRRQRSFFDPTTDRSSVDLGKLGSPIYIYIYTITAVCDCTVPIVELMILKHQLILLIAFIFCSILKMKNMSWFVVLLL